MYRTDNINNYLEDRTKNFTDKEFAILTLGDFLNGTMLVDVNTEEVQEGEYGAKHLSIETYWVLKALGVKTVPLDIMEQMGDNKVYDDLEDGITISDMRVIKTVEQVKGLIAGLFMGVDQVDGETEIINVCYGSYPQSYTSIKGVMGYTTATEFLTELDSYWGQVSWEHATDGEHVYRDLVNKFVDLLLKEEK